MTKFLILGIALVLIFFAIIFYSNRNKKNKVILGQELTSANQKEKEKIERGDHAASPMPEFNYSKWKDEKYLINPKLNELDSFIINLTNKYAKANDIARQEIRHSLSQNDLYTIFTFCQRAVIFGLRKNEPDYITSAMHAISMADLEKCDFRDALVSLAFVNHGIEKAGMDSRSLYDRSFELSNSGMAELLKSFESRKEQDKRLETMAGYTEFQSEFGIGFIQCGYDDYMPKNNLAGIGFKISEFIEKEKYQHASISVAESLPLLWVNGENNIALRSILERSLGTVSVSAYPKEEVCKDWISQMFLLYLIECDNRDDAVKILNIARLAESKNHAKIAISIDEVFCILITRSTTVGVNPFEDSESIKRFKEPLEKLIKENKDN